MKKSATVPWFETVKSSPASWLLVAHKMMGCPALAFCWNTSSTKAGCLWVPNERLKMSMQW